MDTIATCDSPLRIVELSTVRLDGHLDAAGVRAAVLSESRLQLSYDLDRGEYELGMTSTY
jgi:hypothetical protein